MTENERIAGASSVGDDRIFRNRMMENERIAGASSVGDDRIFRNRMMENERKYDIKIDHLGIFRHLSKRGYSL
jgi:hypothetical protein